MGFLDNLGDIASGAASIFTGGGGSGGSSSGGGFNWGSVIQPAFNFGTSLYAQGQRDDANEKYGNYLQQREIENYNRQRELQDYELQKLLARQSSGGGGGGGGAAAPSPEEVQAQLDAVLKAQALFSPYAQAGAGAVQQMGQLYGAGAGGLNQLAAQYLNPNVIKNNANQPAGPAQQLVPGLLG